MNSKATIKVLQIERKISAYSAKGEGRGGLPRRLLVRDLLAEQTEHAPQPDLVTSVHGHVELALHCCEEERVRIGHVGGSQAVLDGCRTSVSNEPSSTSL